MEVYQPENCQVVKTLQKAADGSRGCTNRRIGRSLRLSRVWTVSRVWCTNRRIGRSLRRTSWLASSSPRCTNRRIGGRSHMKRYTVVKQVLLATDSCAVINHGHIPVAFSKTVLDENTCISPTAYSGEANCCNGLSSFAFGSQRVHR